MKLSRIVSVVLLSTVFACSDDNESTFTIVHDPFISIKTSTINRDCTSVSLSGNVGYGAGERFPTLNDILTRDAVKLTGVQVTWDNAGSGASGDAQQFVDVCSLLPLILCGHTWSASIPLAPLENRITITATDLTSTDKYTDTTTVDRPTPSFTASGTLRTAELVSVGYSETHVEFQLTDDGGNSIIPTTQFNTGGFWIPCLANGSYRVTPITQHTFNYAFQPSFFDFTVSGADVPNLDFQTNAYPIMGTFLDETGAPVAIFGDPSAYEVTIARERTSWTRNLDFTGAFAFVVPNGTYTLTPGPSCSSCSFLPADRVVEVNSAVVTGQDFVVAN